MRFMINYIFAICNLSPRQVFYRIYYYFFVHFVIQYSKFTKYTIVEKPHLPFLFSTLSAPEEAQLSVLKITNIQVNPILETWKPASLCKLGIFELNYLDFLSYGKSRSTSTKLYKNWLMFNASCNDRDIWHSYVVSRRIENLTFFYSKNPKLLDKKIVSRHICINLLLPEFNIGGNHLITNCKAILICGQIVENNKKILEKFYRLLDDVIETQFDSEGSHFENSTIYQLIVTAELLDVYHILLDRNLSIPQNFKILLPKLYKKLHAITVNKRLTYFNDAWEDQKYTPDKLDTYFLKLGFKKESGSISTQLSGVQRFSKGGWDVLFNFDNDLAKILPAHLHSSTFALEIYFDGSPLFVNSGCSTYHDLPKRMIEKSIISQNAFCVSGQMSDVFWMPFRRGKKAKTINRFYRSDDSQVILGGTQSGFGRCNLLGPHTRTLTITNNRIIIEDQLMCSEILPCTNYFHLHPDIKVQRINSYSLSIMLNHTCFKFSTKNSRMSVAKGTHSLGFNQVEENVLVILENNVDNLISCNLELI